MRESNSARSDDHRRPQDLYVSKGDKMEVEGQFNWGGGEASNGISSNGRNGSASSSSGHPHHVQDSIDPTNTPPSAFTFSFPPTQTTPGRRRQDPPSSIPDFPAAHEARNPPPAIPFSPSPIHSPAPSSPFRSPEPPTPYAPLASSSRTPGFSIPLHQPFATPSGSGMASPWHSLAASSGAPTPSLESGPMGRSSPHLGYPFERLNIGGSWSGANLWGETGSGRRESVDSTTTQDSSHSRDVSETPSSPPMGVVPPPPVRGLSAETLQRYKSMASASSALPMAKGKNKEAAGPEKGPSSSVPELSLPPLPTLLARRRGSLPKAQPGSTLNLPTGPIAKSPSPLASSSTSSAASPGPNKINPIATRSLKEIIALPTTLILDVRPPSSFQTSHIPASHSLPIPSTLLRRPAFNLQKLTQMLSPGSMEVVSRWKEKSDIVILDTDSNTVPEGSVLDGLAGKFDREGFTGHLWFVKGGVSALKKSGDAPFIAEDDEEDTPEATSAAAAPSSGKGLLAGRLGSWAFQQESTGGGPKRAARPTGLTMPPATPGFDFQSNLFGPSTSTANSAATERPGNSFHNLAIGPPAQTTGAILNEPKRKLQPANPFFDNIRQNLELSHGGITERIPLNLPDTIMNRAEELPTFLKDLVSMPETESMDALAKQFYELELSEQKRLQGVMEWHTKGSGGLGGSGTQKADWAGQRQSDADEVKRLGDWNGERARDQEDYFPFSITAGVERGTKNRYKNIWPYDFSRVRLESPPDQDSDYINASFVQPRGTARRYIATQGPLDATYRDFWTLVWEQDVRVIVMITKQYEGGLMKCGNYWNDQAYGPIRLQMVQQTGGEDHVQQQTTGFDFGPAAVTPRSSSMNNAKEQNIKRVFELSRTDKPDEKPRKIVQIQCIGWPDFDVPESPDVLLNLIKEVDSAADDVAPNASHDRADQPPVLVHCSAGVGRTGSFIVVDAILDSLRREIRSRRSSEDRSSDGRDIPASYFPSSSSSSLPTAPISISPSKRTHSGESTKAVSFLTSPFSEGQAASSENIASTRFTASPGSIPSSAAEMAKQAALSSKKAEQLDDKMELDGPAAREEEVDAHPINPAFTTHRGNVSMAASSEGGGTRRPSLASFTNSSGKLSADAMYSDSGAPMPVTKSDARHRSPSPITEMTNPVPRVLESMRVQRMSLVQTLRQYLFVHRAIIHHYLHMLDEEGIPDSAVDSRYPSRGNSLPATSSVSTATTTASSSAGGTDDEGHTKRRASPTELQPELRLGGEAGSNLSKRPSFKKMRPDVVGMEGSPKKGRTRSRSRLGMDAEQQDMLRSLTGSGGGTGAGAASGSAISNGSAGGSGSGSGSV
ncbi:hypothetical protein CI109_101512 [Kwoniella shandongensis]|uniref:protein-tyrosine-phosphatase n=1 Tax=Kwoniella shandongensis TaxID=1734106 RepID=A0A5M6C9Q5_9TREE|nr:uncharacterized protein CI109_001356 [Kwoniella shandongensis]KAA5530552.1 hypothetical protein CI109_001356 [Kwoniella shandongensis]